MEQLGGGVRSSFESSRAWLPYLVLLGLYLTLRGYHSFEGDQAYRLPILLHQQDPSLFADDPFVRSFDQFNPHRGSVGMLDALSRPIGLPAGLFVVFALTFLGTVRAAARLATSAWGGMGPAVGWVAVGLFLAARAGNIGTNHLFDAMVLDRLVAMAMGWQAIADAIARPTIDRCRSSLWIGLATVVHPSVGLQLALVLTASWIVWPLLGRASEVKARDAWRVAASLGIAVVPGLVLNLWQRSTLQGDLPDRLFWILSVELQGPQHMLPHLWRMPQWLAWFSYLALAILSMGQGRGPEPPPAVDRDAPQEPCRSRLRPAILRLSAMLGVIVVGLAASWYAIEVAHLIRATVFQPFRMSTVARGLALILISGRLVRLWGDGWLGRFRAAVLSVGFVGDWLLVVATLAELAVSTTGAVAGRCHFAAFRRGAPALVYAGMMVLGLDFLAHHDTEYGHIPLLGALAAGILSGADFGRIGSLARFRRTNAAQRSRRWIVAIGLAWAVPFAAMVAAMIPWPQPAGRMPIVRGLIDRCRFVPVPRDDIERLALWCREHTPASSRFIGPPGPKTFRLWSRRNLAFNRAGSPYHGAGLADWFARFQDHVGHHGTPEAFIRAYRDHRHEFEARYEAMTDADRVALAIRQGAGYIIAAAPRDGRPGPTSPVELLHVEGRYAVYRVDPAAIVRRHP